MIPLYGQSQKLDYKISTTVDFYKALELAADGRIEESQKYFIKYYQSNASNQHVSLLDDIVYQLYIDIENKVISTEIAQYIFKSLFGTSENYYEEMLYLNKASDLAPDYEIPYILRGRHHFSKKEYKRALFEFSQLITQKPNIALAYYLRGRTYKLLADYENALKDLNQSLQLNPKMADSHVEKFDIYYELDDYLPAINAYERALNLDSSSVKGLTYSSKLNTMGVHFKETNDYKNALICFSAAVAADSRWVEPYLNRGILNRQLKNLSSSLEDFQKAIEIKPEDMEGYYNRAQTYLEIGDKKQAEKDLIIALNLTDQKEKIHFELAKMYYDQKNYNKAIYHFKATLQSNKNNIWANYWLGVCYDHVQSYKDAINYYRYFLELVPDRYYKHKIHIQNRIKRLKSSK